MNAPPQITSPDDPALEELCQELESLGGALDVSRNWPAQQLELCARYGVFRWFLSSKWGGSNWDYQDVVQGYIRLAQACLTTTFIITQRTGACRRIASSENDELKSELLPSLAAGETFASVGISHLTTSRRHLKTPVLQAEEVEGGYRLNGYSPWVTGGIRCDYVVTGATLEDGRQLLATVNLKLPGVQAAEPENLIALHSSHTGAVHFNDFLLEERWILDGPVENVMAQGTGANTGGLETSSLAIGLAAAAIHFLEQECERREDLLRAAEAFRAEHNWLLESIVGISKGNRVCTNEKLRTRANSLALRSTQAALTAAKGTGFVVGHPCGRWAREAMFFLVWSCPMPVSQAALCELAWIEN